MHPGDWDVSSCGSLVQDSRTVESMTSWHARIVSSLRDAPGFVLPRIARCDAGAIAPKRDPWAGLYKRPIGVTAIRTLTSPYNVGFTVARNMSLAFLGLTHKHILLLTEAEEKAIETNSEPEPVPFPWDELPVVLKRGGLNSCMDLTVLSMRGMLDWVAGDLVLSSRCSAETIVRMHTDMRRTSKALAPAYPMAQRFTRVAKTALWSEMTFYVSEWLVTSVLDAVRLVMEGKDRFVQRILLKMTVNSARCATLWVAVSVGNGLGASSPKMRPLTMLIGANAAALIVNLYWRRVWSRVEYLAFGDNGEGDAKKGDSNGEDDGNSSNGAVTVSGAEEASRDGRDGDDRGPGADGVSSLSFHPSISPTGIPRPPSPQKSEVSSQEHAPPPSQPLPPSPPSQPAGVPPGPSGIPRLPVRRRRPPSSETS